MLPFLKKKSDAPAAPVVPAWHPNFRNYEKLPDIKVVRTTFFVNGVAILLAASMAIYFGFREWQLRVIQGQIDQAQAHIDRTKKSNDQAVATFKKFQAEEARIKEVDTFLSAKLTLSPLMLRIGETLPPNIAIDSIDLRDAGMMLRLSVKGAPDTAPAYATAYLEQLRTDKQLSEFFDDVSFTSTPTFNPATGRMVVEFMLRLKGAKK